MDKSFDPKTIETQWYPRWEGMGCFQPSGEGTPYSIMLPPPNVTGTLHMGHAFQHTLQDALIRWHRMRGYDTLWQIGTDHAGIATEMVVGRLLEREGQTRNGVGRPAFIERVLEVVPADPAARAGSRLRWKAYAAKGCTLAKHDM